MSIRRILAVARRVAQGFRRDERTLGLMFVVPLVVTALLGWVLSEQKEETIRVVVVNEAGTIGDTLVRALQDAAADPGNDVEITRTVTTEPEADSLIRDGTATIGIVIPANLLEAITAGERPTLTVITQGIEPAADAGRFGTLQGVMAQVVTKLVPPGAQAPVVPQVERRTIYLSPDASQADVFAPIFLALFGYFFVYLLTGISFLRERIGGTLERLLATPVTRGEIVVGYSLGFSAFAAIQVVLLTLFILNSVDVPAIGPLPPFTIGFGVASMGSPYLAFAVALLLSIGAVNLGIFLSTFARTELQILQFIPLVLVPQILLGGVFWPIDRLPDVLHAISRVLPLTYAVEALREVMLKGADLTSTVVQTDLAVLAGIALLFVVLASGTIKREVA